MKFIEKKKTPKKPAKSSTSEIPADSQENQLAALYESSLADVQENSIVQGVVVEIKKRQAIVDIGYKSEGILDIDEFPEPEKIRVGSEVEVLFESYDDEQGIVILSKRKADRLKCWNDIVATSGEGSIVEGKIFKKVRGGFMVDIGMEAFLPASLVALKPTKNLDQFLGQTLKFKIVKLNHRRRNIVLSRKDFLEQEQQSQRSKILGEMTEGKVLKGRVKNITDFGVFIDLGGVDGLLHITDMSWGRVAHPSELVSLGQELELTVVGYDKETQRISLGLKQLTSNPWQTVESKYKTGSRIRGKVVNILPYGAFVELEKGIEGLVHVSELSWTKRIAHPSEVLNVGDEVEAVILNVDVAGKKIALGIKQIEADPWKDVHERYKVGQTIEGVIRNVTDYGAFIELEPGIGGLIHISDMSWTKKINHPTEVVNKGDQVKLKILSIDAEQKKISLGIKQLAKDPWLEVTEKLPVNQIVEGRVTKVTNFGVFVEVLNDIEGLLHISEIPEDVATLEERFRPGDEVRVMVLRVDPPARKIALSLKGVLVGSGRPQVKNEEDE
ncbi:MAG: 30S ribosomal protein S1 [Candidatus Omnitrophica bacterium]|nr:30S ribosomal protein S1 [Candidatus Omnitrophota bacterium]